MNAEAVCRFLAHIPAKWTPVRRQEYAPIKDVRAYSDSAGTEYALRNRNQQPDADGERFLLVLIDRVSRLDEPAEFSLRPWPHHQVERERRAPFYSFLARVAPRRPGAHHEFQRVGKREWLLENDVGFELGDPAPE